MYTLTCFDLDNGVKYDHTWALLKNQYERKTLLAWFGVVWPDNFLERDNCMDLLHVF